LELVKRELLEAFLAGGACQGPELKALQIRPNWSHISYSSLAGDSFLALISRHSLQDAGFAPLTYGI